MALDAIRAALGLRGQIALKLRKQATAEADQNAKVFAQALLLLLAFVFVHHAIKEAQARETSEFKGLPPNNGPVIQDRISRGLDGGIAKALARSDRVIFAVSLIIGATAIWTIALIPAVDHVCKMVAAAVGLGGWTPPSGW